MKWDVRGAWKADGGEGSMSVEAPTQRAAEDIAALRGLLVESCWPAVLPSADQTPAPFRDPAAAFIANTHRNEQALHRATDVVIDTTDVVVGRIILIIVLLGFIACCIFVIFF